eukprot:7217712-Prymnesium_polylepis.1
MASYPGRPLSAMPPHVYAIAERALRSLASSLDGSSQSIVISGESGSGKTESAKHVMTYLCKARSGRGRHGRRPMQDVDGLVSRILGCNPVLESFGNAMTVMNNNSSRFGKYTRIHFDRDSLVCGADIVTYLLEESRVTVQSTGERS